jgi:hypothetical protein
MQTRAKIFPEPGLYPRTGLPLQTPDSERKVYAALAGALPSGWHAWHSLKLRTKEGKVVEGDFVIAAPDFGILILEVKGGHIEKREGAWFQNGQPMKMDPLEQAMRARKCLIAKFRERGILFPPVGEAVVFPDTEVDAQPSQGNLEGLVLGARELLYLEEYLPELIRKAVPRFFRVPTDGAWIDALQEMWCECWPKRMNLSAQVSRDLSDRIELDEAQFTALQAVIENDIVVVRGGAGTGKTILARELARKEAAAGKSVLVLTYTEALGMELAKRLESVESVESVESGKNGESGRVKSERVKSGRVTVSSIGRFALKRLRDAGFDDPESYEPAFWEKVTKQAAERRSLWKGCGWDTVIVDEAQDLGKHEWNIATRCARKPPRIWCFADEGQAFWADRKIPQSIRKNCVLYNLQKAYRCPLGVQALAEAYLGRELDKAAIEADMRKGIIGIRACEEGNVHQAVGEEVAKLVTDGFEPGEIAIISLRGLLFPGSIVHKKEVGGYGMAMATDGKMGERIVCDTFLRYKGLERPAIIVTDLQHEVEQYNIRMNIAVSRAFGALRVVGASREMEKDPIISRVAEFARST